MNGMYLRAMSEEEFFETAKPYIEEGVHKNVDLRSVAKILQPRTDVLTTIPEAIDL